MFEVQTSSIGCELLFSLSKVFICELNLFCFEIIKMFDSNILVNRPPSVIEGFFLYIFGFVVFQLTFHDCHRWLQTSGFLDALQRLLLSSDDVINSKKHSRDVIKSKQHSPDVAKSNPHFDEASIFELSNWIVSTLQVCLLNDFIQY